MLRVDLHDVGHRHLQLQRLAVYVSDVDAALVVEEDDVHVPLGVDAHIGLLSLRVRKERFYDELAQLSCRLTNLIMISV